MWGITNKSSLLSDYSPRNVHAALQPFMMLVSADEKLFGALNDLNSAMSSLWDCAHKNPTSSPGILKAKMPLLGRASSKNARGPAAAELLLSLWDSDFSNLKALLKTQLLPVYPRPVTLDEHSAFNVLFTFRTTPTSMPDLNPIGNSVVPRHSRSSKVAKQKTTVLPTTAVNTTCAPLPATPTTIKSSDCKIYLPPPGAVVGIATLMESAELVFCKPVAPVKLQWLHSLRLGPNSPPKGPFKDLVLRKFNKLLDNTADGILIGRVFFYYAFEDATREEINYNKAYVQPGVVTLPDPISDQYTNFVEVYWFSANYGDITIPYEQQLQHLSFDPPHIQFHSWDALNPNPSSVFSPQAYGNGLLLFPPLSSFLIS